MGIMDRRQKLSITFMHSIMDVMKNAMIISINWLITFWLYGYKKNGVDAWKPFFEWRLRLRRSKTEKIGNWRPFFSFILMLKMLQVFLHFTSCVCIATPLNMWLFLKVKRIWLKRFFFNSWCVLRSSQFRVKC